MSTHFVWDGKRLKLHLTSKNQDHIVLVNKMNELFEANNAATEKHSLLEKLNELYFALEYHIRMEEKYFRHQEPSDYGTHKRFHFRFLTSLKKHIEDFQNQPQAKKIPEPFFAFFTLWLSADIKHLELNYYPEKNTMKTA